MACVVALLGAALVILLVGSATPQHQDHGSRPSAPAGPETTLGPQPIRITPEAVHANGGIPPDWRFALPPGNPQKGREIFVRVECFKCHEVTGEHFPQAGSDVGPPLGGMGLLHPAEYLAESILSPNRVILESPGFTGPDGLSRMPSYNEVLTVQELLDLVAYLKSVAGEGAGGHAGH